MAKIVEIKQTQDNYEIGIDELLEVFYSQGRYYIDVRYEGEEEGTWHTIELYQLYSRSYNEDATVYNCFYATCNKLIMRNVATRIEPNTNFEIGSEYVGHTAKFADFATIETNGKAILHLRAFTDYGDTGNYYEIEFDFELNVNGYKNIILELRQQYFPDYPERQLQTYNFNIICYDAHNNEIAFDKSMQGIYFNGYSLIAYNRISGRVYEDSYPYFPGVFDTFIRIYPSLFLDEFQWQVVEYCYNYQSQELVVEPLKTAYFQFEQIQQEDLNVFLRYEIDATHNYDEQIYGYNTIPTRFNTITLSQQVQVDYNNFSKTYNVSVSGIPTDNVYYFDKKSPFAKHLLGELQTDFNMCFSLDESRDTCKIKILSYVANEIEPNTIIYFQSTDTWWCVEKDKVDIHQNEQNTLYEHTIDLTGAIDLLGSRDLTNCGFNSERYTITNFLNRLKTFSDFEMNTVFSISPAIDSRNSVDYIKTFENYTYLSALKEFFNGYNCIPKMTFSRDVTQTEINSATIKAHSKSGTRDTPIDISVFDEITEQKSIERENYGSRVVSNVQNCVSRKSIRYPSIGSCWLVGNNGEVTYDTANGSKLLLPTNAYYVESITFYNTVFVRVEFAGNVYEFPASPDDLSRKGNETKRLIKSFLSEKGASLEILNDLETYWSMLFNAFMPTFRFQLDNGGYYDAISKEKIGSYLTAKNVSPKKANKAYLFLNNDNYSYNSDGTYYFNLTWKQGSNEITGFDAIAEIQKAYPGYGVSNFNTEQITISRSGYSIKFGNNYLTLLDNLLSPLAYRTLYCVKYIPMNDIKVKTENDRDFNDSKLYNQNGKLVDSYAVSKLINGYAQSISSNEIVKNKVYYNFFNIPQVGQRVKNGNDIYVINNVSIDFVMNDNNHYIMPCQFNMTKYSACKSFMVSANSKIRDYDCPQQNNIKRVQCYRDYIELDYTRTSAVTSYLDFNLLFNVSTSSIGIENDLCAFVRATDSSFYNPQDFESNKKNYYYRIPHTIYTLNKHYIISIDFNDNNIIGYGNKNANKPFSLSNIIDHEKIVTAPISYVDSYGEVDGLEVILTQTYNAESAFGEVFMSDNCAIAPTIYQTCKSHKIANFTESNYNKDGLEVPVFQYSAECGDTNGIIMADNFFEYEKGTFSFYLIVYSSQVTNENSSLVSRQSTKYQVNLSISSKQINVTQTSSTINLLGKNFGIFAKKGNDYRFLFGCNDFKNNSTNVSLFINNYKLN